MTPELARAVIQAAHPLARMSWGRTRRLLLHEDGAGEDEDAAYLMRWALWTEPRAGHGFSFANDPLWRSYVTTYADGERVCARWVAGEPRALPAARHRAAVAGGISPRRRAERM